MKLSKKAQFYLFTALILTISVLVFAKPSVVLESDDGTFKLLYDNYITEASKVVNNALYDGASLMTRFEDFNNQFDAYSQTKGMKFGFAGIIATPNSTIVMNKLNEDVDLIYLTAIDDLTKDSIVEVNNSESIQIKVRDYYYPFNFTEGVYEVKGLFYAKGTGFEKFYAYN